MAINRAQEFVIRIIEDGKVLEGEIKLSPIQSSLLSLYINSNKIIPPSDCAQLLDVDVSQISRANSQIITKITERYFDQLSFEIPMLFFNLGELKKFEDVCLHQINTAKQQFSGEPLEKYYEKFVIELSQYPNIRSVLKLMNVVYHTVSDPHLSISQHCKNAIALSVLRRKFLSSYVWRQRGRNKSTAQFTAELNTLGKYIIDEGHEATIYRFYNTSISFHSGVTHDYVALRKAASDYILYIKDRNISKFSAKKLGWIALAHLINGQYESVINIVDQQTIERKMLEDSSFSLKLYYFLSLLVQKDIKYVRSRYEAIRMLYPNGHIFSYKDQANLNVVEALISFFGGEHSKSKEYLHRIVLNNTLEKYSLSLDVFIRILDSAISMATDRNMIAINEVNKNVKWFRRNGYNARTYERIFLKALIQLAECQDHSKKSNPTVKRLRSKLSYGIGGVYGKLLDCILSLKLPN